jgi:hypothetical protein
VFSLTERGEADRLPGVWAYWEAILSGALLISLSWIGRSYSALGYGALVFCLEAVNQLRHKGVGGIKQRVFRVIREVVPIAILAWAPFFLAGIAKSSYDKWRQADDRRLSAERQIETENALIKGFKVQIARQGAARRSEPLYRPAINVKNGIQVSGGNVNQPTVNNFNVTKKPDRRISEADKPMLVEILSANPGKVAVSAMSGDPEAYQFALDWYNVLETSGWDVGPRVMVFTIMGEPLIGVEMAWRGPEVRPGEHFLVSSSSPEGRLWLALQKESVGGLSTISDQRMPEGRIALAIGSAP